MSIVPHPFRIDLSTDHPGATFGAGAQITAPARLSRLVAAFIEDVHTDTGLRLTAPAAEGADQGSGIGAGAITVELVPELDTAAPRAGGASPAAGAVGGGPSNAGEPRDERYRLSVTDRALVTACNAAGAAAGLASLRNLIATAQVGSDESRTVAACEIDDGPRYAWRSFKLDVGRYWYPVAEVKKVIAQLSRYKVNALVLHLVDNEGWRIEIEGYPEVSAASEKRYTQQDLREIVDYARHREITVIAEIDLPGHCKALLDAHPEFGVLEHVEGHDIAYVDPASSELWDFLLDVYSQMLDLTGSGFLHLGGDEAFRMPDDMFADFVHHASALARTLGAEPICYQEGCRAGLKAGSLTQFWVDFAGPGGLIDDLEERAARGEELPFGMKPAAFPFYREGYADLGRAEKQELGVILSPTSHAYFDVPFADTSADSAQESDRQNIGLPLYRAQTLEEYSDWNPSEAFVGLDPQFIAGVEATLWSDSIRQISDMQTLLLPRLPGYAERAWSHTPRQWQDLREALAAQAPSWESSGLQYFSSSSIPWK